MKFKEAFDLAFEIQQEKAKEKNEVFQITVGTAKILAFMWSMLAIAQNVLDDSVTIGDNMQINSVSLKDMESKGQKSSTTKTAKKIDKLVENDVSKEKQESTE
jgi:hypothetical protein